MERIAEFAGSHAEWVQPASNQRYYELHDDTSVMASLRFRSAFGTLAVATTADESWTFKRVGFLNIRVTVRRAGEDHDMAVYTPRFWGDGELTFEDGAPPLLWRPTNFWATQWAFGAPAGGLIMEFKTGVPHERLSDIFKTQATVEILDAAEWRPLLPLLLPLGFYLFLMHHEDAAAGAAAISAAAG
jgi:hypothetical protein